MVSPVTQEDIVRVGIPSEIKDNEQRVSLQPDGAAELVHHGHEVLVQSGAGTGSRFTDEEYAAAGARVVADADAVFAEADLVVKVKEPVPAEYHRFREGQQLFTYLHAAADRSLTDFLLERRIDSIAYETVQTADGRLPLLTPMSEVAGRMAVQAAAHHLESPAGGAGILMGGVPGTPAAKVTIIGGGVSGTEAAKIAVGMRAIVRVFDTNPARLAYLSDVFEGRLDLVQPNRARLAQYVADSDVLIGAVLVPGTKAPKLVSREMVASMRPGSVAVDIAIDQGGCFETSRPTTHSDPTYVEEGVVHYCVANIPGAVARTSTLALTSATLAYLVTVADSGIRGAAASSPVLAKGLTSLGGQLTSEPVAAAHGLPWTSAAELL
ncbi:alanine dehydrogenase [Klenkia taihuensis]|uniref:Alanine dehydrogenase n=1 Tax=Klenkia taihuensis TaxID=1225127 RepID=A0A1I1G831_9ACTN|nr:alanine dehydrogenase [Klenkia taihuensis]SFC07869.1 L-alanine dehydrogenase [Klenkia taihuensis]